MAYDANRVMAGATMILAACAVGGIFLSYCSNRNAERAAEAAKESADAAVASVRAWVAVVNWTPVPPPEMVNGGIGIKILNVGKTSGLSVQVREEALFLAPGEKEPTFTKCPSSEPFPVGNTIEPEDKLSPPIPPLPLSTRLDSKQIGALGRGSRLILHGCITYKNVIAPSNEPVAGLTEFCSVFYGYPDRNLTKGCRSGNQMK